MTNRLLKTLTLLALSGACATALADDPPSLVGRVALAQGQVSITGGPGEPGAAQVNWPVTAGEMITTARGARTELQVGSSFIRLDGDSSLEVLDMDEDNLRLRLHYGSASIRILDRAMLDGFELSTPEGRVRMQEPGRLRVDAERMADTSSVTVLDGVALVENGGASLTVRAGKRADLQFDDVRTVAAGRDEFDDWATARDRAVQASASARYVSTDMTGYADLDRYGSWRTDPEYGALWTPTAVGPSWVPYSDGSWVWLQPWGWTWVDNSPWGYAPFHYGRWVVVNHRWCWAPGRREHRPVWAPALVGWVGGDGWNASFRMNNRHQALPARGWYPLSPRDRFVPAYRLSDDRLRRLNGDVRPDYRHRWDDHQRAGLTVVPQAQFSQLARIAISKVPRASVPAQALNTAPSATPPAAPPGVQERDWRRGQRRNDDRLEPAQQWRDRVDERRQMDHRGDERAREQTGRQQVLSTQPQQPAAVLTAPSQPARPAAPERLQPRQPFAAPNMPQPQPPVVQEHRQPQQPVTVPAAPPAAAGQQTLERLQWRMERRERGDEDRARGHQLSTAPAPVPAAVAPAPQQAAPAPAPDERFERPRRPDSGFERRREMMAPAPAPAPLAVSPPAPAPVHMPAQVAPSQPAPPPMARQAPTPQPMARPMPMPQAAPAPQGAPAPAPGQAPERHHGPRRDDNQRQQER